MEEARYKIQLRNFAVKMNLPMTISDERTYRILREGITGDLANVGHRYNYAGETRINKHRIEEGERRVVSYETTLIPLRSSLYLYLLILVSPAVVSVSNVSQTSCKTFA
jgi:hypothetical protein